MTNDAVAPANCNVRRSGIRFVAGTRSWEGGFGPDEEIRALSDRARVPDARGEIVGSSEALQALVSRLARVAPTESTVLISGETGTGKELVAYEIHRRSLRALQPIVRVNCAAVPAGLIATELFGHEKEAFTGATHRRAGRFELAAGGTLFLDEVGEPPMETQFALLRVTQQLKFERVGGAVSIRANVRIVAGEHGPIVVPVRR